MYTTKMGHGKTQIVPTKQELLDYIYHLQDDLETVRGDTIRVLTAEIRMLGDGLHALQRRNPKVHVMIDHAERSRDNLIKLLTAIRCTPTTTLPLHL